MKEQKVGESDGATRYNAADWCTSGSFMSISIDTSHHLVAEAGCSEELND